MSGRYRPRPGGLERDIRELLHVLAIALRNLDRGHVIGAGTEETTAGLAYDEPKQR
jgi:hypothetical protein